MAKQLTTSAFNRLAMPSVLVTGLAYCYAELTVSSLAMAEAIASTHCVYPRRDDQAEYTGWRIKPGPPYLIANILKIS